MFGAWHYTAPPPVMTLKPGDSAYAVVEADNQPAGNNADCPAPYVRLRVSPPGDSGKRDSLRVVAWRRLDPTGLHIGQRFADSPDVDDYDARQPSSLGTGRTRRGRKSDKVADQIAHQRPGCRHEG